MDTLALVTKLKKTSRTVLLACLALLACTAVALAAHPKAGPWKGKTDQDKRVRFTVKDGDVKFFKIFWKATCEKTDDSGKHYTWDPAEPTRNKGAIDVADDGTFKRSGEYDSDLPNGYTQHVKAKLNGKFNTKKKASGTFKVTAKVKQNGDYVDTCRKTVTWAAHLAED